MALVDIPLERQEFIRDLAADVWQTYSGERQVFVTGIIDAVDIGLTCDDFEDAFDGLIEHRFGRFHIYCNTAGGLYPEHPRVRFTLAHELGHYFIDEHRNALMAGEEPHSCQTDQPSRNPAEHEANIFASNLLMPQKEFWQAVGDVSSGLTGIIDLASTFGVSIQSAALRFVADSASPCAIVMFRDAGKPWWDMSPELKALGISKFHRFDKGLVPGEVTALAKSDSTKCLGMPHSGEILAGSWFTQIPESLDPEIVIMESSVRLGARGALTLLQLKSV